MNTVTFRDRLLALSPLVLRASVAAILAYCGWNQMAPLLNPETGQAISASASGVAINANWNTMIGVAEFGVAFSLLFGLFTRLVSAGVIGAVAYCVYSAANAVDTEFLSTPARMFDASGTAMLLLAAACASLLVSGGGVLAIDNRLFAKPKSDTSMPV